MNTAAGRVAATYRRATATLWSPNTLVANLFGDIPHGVTFRFNVFGGPAVDTVNIVYKGVVNGRLFTTFTDAQQSPVMRR